MIPETTKLCTLQGFCQAISYHVLAWYPHDLGFLFVHPISDTKISNIHMLRTFTTGRLTIGLQQYTTLIVLQYYVPGVVQANVGQKVTYLTPP